MKNSILLPLFFLLYFLLFFIFLSIVSVFYHVIVNHVDLQHLSPENIYSYIMFSMMEVLPAVILFALFLLFFRILIKPGNRILSYVFTVITSTLLLTGSIIVITMITPRKVQESREPDSFINAGYFNELGDNVLYTGAIRKDILSDNLLLDISNTKKNQKLFYSDKAYGEEFNGKMEITFSGSLRKKIILDRDLLKNRYVSMDFFTKELLSSYNIFTTDLKKYAAQGGLAFYLLCFAFCFLIMTTNMFMRISKWPLFNFIFLFFILTGIFFLYKLYATIILVEIQKLISDSFFISLIPILGMIVLGVLFFLFDILFVPSSINDEVALS
ncbi:MAG: hypothetical protein JXJ04_02040 [Spirochaetales bacterium]|nr:hypothetical protein [Spirochaetales bacterium]